MGQHLVLSIRLHDDRYHGVDEWPPAPARVFQALVAGAARGNALPPDARSGLEWLERLPPPTIAAPRARRGQRIELYVPNNDADALGGDLDRVGEIRTKKVVAPRLLEGDDAFVYAWPIGDTVPEVERIQGVVLDLYQFGRGVDMAWAAAEVLDDEALAGVVAQHRGSVHYPTRGDGRGALACPGPGSLASLVRRHAAASKRLLVDGEKVLFSQPPKPWFVQVAYDAPTWRGVYELRASNDIAEIKTWPVVQVVALVERLRDGAAERLRSGLPGETPAIDRALIGRRPDGTNAATSAERVRIVPLSSIGHEYADRAIRRILVEVPASCPVPARDIHWAFSGLEAVDPQTGEVAPFVLTPTSDERMLGHYTSGSRLWRTVTPAALPEAVSRRRIEPTRRREEAKGAAERAAEEARAVAAVRTALRHAGQAEPVARVNVQREPFESRATRAERFAVGTRFAKERLWHVELEFQRPVEGPLVLGDGRYLGLGVMSPAETDGCVYALRIERGRTDAADPVALARALRRAVMSRAQVELGRGPLPAFFSGHSESGTPARREEVAHLAFQWDGDDRLLILAPHGVDRRAPKYVERGHLGLLERALAELTDLRAGGAGRLTLTPLPVDAARDVVLAPARTWRSLTPYFVNRHRKLASSSAAVIADVLDECVRLELPAPIVGVHLVEGVPGEGLRGVVSLRFPVAVRGPIVLGRARYLGGGLFGGQDTAATQEK